MLIVSPQVFLSLLTTFLCYLGQVLGVDGKLFSFLLRNGHT